MAEQPVDHVFADAVFEFFARDCWRIQKSAAVLPSIEQLLFVKAVERRHQGGIGDSFVKGEIEVAHAHFAALPGFIQDLAFELSERERGNFTRPPKSTEKK